MGQEKTFSENFFLEEPLSEEQLVRNLEKPEEEVIRKNVIRKIVSRDTKAFPPDGRTQKFKSSLNTDLVWDNDRHGWLRCSSRGRGGSISRRRK